MGVLKTNTGLVAGATSNLDETIEGLFNQRASAFPSPRGRRHRRVRQTADAH